MNYIKLIFKICIILILLVMIVLVYRNNLSKNEQIIKLQNRLEKLEYEIEEKDKKINELVDFKENFNFSGGMLYIEPKYKVRFIEKELKLLLLPYEKSYVLNIIEPNTLIKVNDLVEVKGERWLNVTIPVYDSPMDFKGWVKESDTVPFTEEKEKKVQSDVSLKENTPYYEVSDVNEIIKDNIKKLPYDVNGRIEQNRNGFVLIEAPGGCFFGVEEKYVIYPKSKQ